MFQFPSNGNAYTKQQFFLSSFFLLCFNSLQTGTHIQSLLQRSMEICIAYTVSIPFKRERIYKVNCSASMAIPRLSVSIPFKRERIYKDGRSVFRMAEYGFNSLQTGTHIQSWKVACFYLLNFRFQFPSNGNAYTKEGQRLIQGYVYVCFNSLQTGTHIQRSMPSF